MTYEEVTKKLDFLIRSYQNLIDNQVSEGEIVGPGVKGTWKADTPLIEAYQNMIEALMLAKLAIKQNQMLKLDYNARLKDDMAAMLDKIGTEIKTKYGQCKLTEYIAQYDGMCTSVNDIGDIADILQLIDKYKIESEPQESEVNNG